MYTRFNALKLIKHLPILLIITGTVLFLAGYFMDTETIRILWLILSALIAILGIIAIVFVRLIKKAMLKEMQAMEGFMSMSSEFTDLSGLEDFNDIDNK